MRVSQRDLFWANPCIYLSLCIDVWMIIESILRMVALLLCAIIQLWAFSYRPFLFSSYRRKSFRDALFHVLSIFGRPRPSSQFDAYTLVENVDESFDFVHV